ncbi:MAG: hypothetical protein JF609_02780, partial [Verrucomicrobia bacterium]|nr:hypothetical protein [Verrucomicrobiota bacterium]
VRAVLWYQGESNYDPSQYSELLPAFMNGWRACFGRPNLPFIVCQLANYSTAQTQPVEPASYAELREAQLNSVRADAGSRLATLIDVGRPNSASTATVDLHQPNKEQVGQRCAWAALNLVYGQNIYNQGPFFSGATVQGTNMLCTFTNIGAGLTAGWFVQLSPVVPTNGALTGFAIAGANKTFYSAGAVIVSNDTIAVSSPSVPGPLYVRYAWGNNPAANLYGEMTNAVGTVVDCLPASSFRNDPVYGLSVNNGTGGNLNLSPGATASISASNAPAGESFGYWTGDTAQLSATNATSCTATMNKPYVAVLANYAIINAPASVQAVPGDGQVMLSWGTLSGSHYNIKRATSAVGPFSVIYSNVNATNAVDVTATNGVTYYYQVAGTNLISEGPFSAALAAAPNASIPPLPPLIHRYSFNESSGTIAHDSVGGVNGTLNGGAIFDGSGHVVLNGTSGTYVSLPGNLLAGLSNVTLEAWVTNAVSPDNVALFSFDDGLQDGVGGGYLRYVLHDQSNGRNFLELASGSGNSFVAGNPGLGGRSIHVACVYSATNAIIYTNGVLETSLAVSTPLASVSMNSASLGRSPWNGDPWLAGSIDEFRVYGGAMNSNQVAI